MEREDTLGAEVRDDGEESSLFISWCPWTSSGPLSLGFLTVLGNSKE